KGFFTDTSVCIGCKACEVACKEWNLIPEDGIELSGMSYDNTQARGASTWRRVAFIEQEVPARGGPTAGSPGADGHAGPSAPVDLGMPAPTLPGESPDAGEP